MLNVDEAPVAPGGSTHAKLPPGTVGVTVMSQPGAGAYTALVAVWANLRIVSDGEHNSSTSVRIASASASKSSINATSVVSMSNPAMVRATTGPDTCVSRVTLAWFCNAAPTPIANTRDPRDLTALAARIDRSCVSSRVWAVLSVPIPTSGGGPWSNGSAGRSKS